MDQTKIPAAETLKASTAYDTIFNLIKESEKSAKDATEVSDQVAMMVILLVYT